jgi:hypothetical protein
METAVQTNDQLAQIMAAAKLKRDQEKADADQAKAQKAADSAQRKQELEAKKVERERLKAERDAKKVEKQPEANGVRRPRPDSLCGQAWAVMDEVTLRTGEMAQIKDVVARAQELNPTVNLNNVRGEYVRWKRFNGVI